MQLICQLKYANSPKLPDETFDHETSKLTSRFVEQQQRGPSINDPVHTRSMRPRCDVTANSKFLLGRNQRKSAYISQITDCQKRAALLVVYQQRTWCSS